MIFNKCGSVYELDGYVFIKVKSKSDERDRHIEVARKLFGNVYAISNANRCFYTSKNLAFIRRKAKSVARVLHGDYPLLISLSDEEYAKALCDMAQEIKSSLPERKTSNSDREKYSKDLNTLSELLFEQEILGV